MPSWLSNANIEMLAAAFAGGGLVGGLLLAPGKIVALLNACAEMPGAWARMIEGWSRQSGGASVAETRWLTGDEVCSRTRWSRPTLRRRVAAGLFPAPIERDRWIEAEVEFALQGKAVEPRSGERWGFDRDAYRAALAEIKAQRPEPERQVRCRHAAMAPNDPGE